LPMAYRKDAHSGSGKGQIGSAWLAARMLRTTASMFYLPPGAAADLIQHPFKTWLMRRGFADRTCPETGNQFVRATWPARRGFR
jgi:hypothetical protein